MTSAKLKPVSEINLEEFERRLRAAVAPPAGVEDPLAELTRLVDTMGVERAASDRTVDFERALRMKPKADLRLAAAPPVVAPPKVVAPKALAPPLPALPPQAPPQAVAPAAPAPASPPEPVAPPPPPPLSDAEPTLRPSFDAEDRDSDAIEPPAPAFAEVEDEVVPVRGPPTPPRAPHWGIKIGGLLTAAAMLSGALVVFKLGGHAHSGPPPLILASTAPTKVPPPSEATVRTPNESGALLTRDTAQPTPTPPKLVDTPEAPVDLSARPQPQETSLPTPDAAPAPVPAALAGPTVPLPSAEADADPVSPVAPSSDTPVVPAVVAKAPPPAAPVGDDPSRVKTISVRPDGTLISSGYETADPTPTAATAPAAPAPATADVEPSTPAVALPTKLSPPKTPERVVSATATTAPADAGSGPAPAAPKPKKPKPVAEAEVNSDDAQAQAQTPGGGYSVQLAAPKTESDAKALIKRLQGRYADALGGASLGVRKADRHGEAIYRVRALGLSKADAAAMCTKIKAAGGDCYVAKN